MRLIEFAVVLAVGITLVPLVAEAQRPSIARVGVLSPGKPPPDDAFRQQEHFEAGLRELGWTLGSNIIIDYRYADGNLDRLPALAAELVRIPVNVIVARGLTIRAAREATAAIPIVMAADPDPVRSGFVASLARPGGNITGLSTLAPDLDAKQLELLREALPSLVRVGVLVNANSRITEETTRLEATTRALHFTLTESRITRSEQLDAAFAEMRQAGVIP
jgi:putative ABC transport system substrate-binding protein